MEPKKYNVGRKALQVFLDEKTHVRFKALCAMRGVKMSDVISDMVDQWVKDNGKAPVWAVHTDDE